MSNINRENMEEALRAVHEKFPDKGIILAMADSTGKVCFISTFERELAETVIHDWLLHSRTNKPDGQAT